MVHISRAHNALPRLTQKPDTVGSTAIIPRWATIVNVSLEGTGDLALTYFDADQDLTVTRLRAFVSDTAAGGTVTLAKLGLYAVADSGDLSRVVATANDVDLFDGTFSAAERAVVTPGSVLEGQRLAAAILVVSDGTMPSLQGSWAVWAEVNDVEPRMAGVVHSMSDLPASIDSADIEDTSRIFDMRILAA